MYSMLLFFNKRVVRFFFLFKLRILINDLMKNLDYNQIKIEFGL